jgi:hypothetical protein
MGALSHRKPVSAGTLRDSCRTERHYVQLVWDSDMFEFGNNRNIRIYLLSLASSSVVVTPLLWDINCKVHPTTGYERTEGSRSIARWGGWLTPRPGRFTPGKRPGADCIGGWVGTRAGLDG